jgi:hypothetical protein
MGGTRLKSGIEVNLEPNPLLRFSKEEWAYYDGIIDREPNSIIPEDVLVTVAVNSRVDNADRVRAVHRGMAKACDRLLVEIPVDADIRTYDLDGSHAKELLAAACGVKFVAMAVATKILHRKRRSWIPMLDSVVNVAYLDALGKQGLKSRLDQGSEAGGVGAFIMNAFRQDLTEVDSEVGRISEELRAAELPLTDVRILEIAIWQAVEPRGYYR